jgi:hypothetical protein
MACMRMFPLVFGLVVTTNDALELDCVKSVVWNHVFVSPIRNMAIVSVAGVISDKFYID